MPETHDQEKEPMHMSGPTVPDEMLGGLGGFLAGLASMWGLARKRLNSAHLKIAQVHERIDDHEEKVAAIDKQVAVLESQYDGIREGQKTLEAGQARILNLLIENNQRGGM
jgi:hypothetical protein